MSGPLKHLQGGFGPSVPELRSGLFNGTDEYLTRTPGAAGNRTRFVLGCWVNLVPDGTNHSLFSADTNTSNRFVLRWEGDDITAFSYIGGAFQFLYTTRTVFRDSGWYHVVFDYENGVGEIWVNGEKVPLVTRNDAAVGHQPLWNSSGVEHRIGDSVSQPQLANGFISQALCLDGRSIQNGDVQITELGRVHSQGNAQWWTARADADLIELADTAGGQSFVMDFNAIGTDASANRKNFLAVNMDTTNLSLHSPANPHALLNPLDQSIAGQSNIIDGGTAHYVSVSTFAGARVSQPLTGKMYAEARVRGDSVLGFGINAAEQINTSMSNFGGATSANPAFEYIVNGFGTYHNGATVHADAVAFADGDIFQVAYDADTGNLWIGRDDAWYGGGDPGAGVSPTFSDLDTSLTWFIVLSGGVGSANRVTLKIAERDWTYAAPTDFLPVTHANKPQPANQGADYFNALLYTADGADMQITGAGFQPDAAWLKRRDAVGSHRFVDNVRGVEKALFTDTTAVEAVEPDGLEAFLVDGFQLGMDPNYNTNTHQYTAWLFREGPHFKIVRYTGDSVAGRTVAHSLPGAPELLIVKARTDAVGWRVWHQALASTQYLDLGTTAAAATAASLWNSTVPDATNFTLGNASATNNLNSEFVAYVFRSVPGLCKVGSYTGNANADGPYIHCGFRPRWVMVKRIGAVSNWLIFDTARNAADASGFSMVFYANTNDVDAATGNWLRFYADGFKIRDGEFQLNANGDTFIFIALADAVSGGSLPSLPAGYPVDLDAVTADVPPSITTDPTLSGTVQIGQTLTATPGAQDGTEPITTAYEFRHADNTIIQAGSSTVTYTIQTSDYGEQIKVVQTATGTGTPAARESALTVAVPASAPGFGSGQPLATSGNKAGDTVTITSAPAGSFTGFPAPTHVQYDIYRVGTPDVLIQADIAPGIYTLPSDEIGNQYFIRQTISNPADSVTADSPDYGPVTEADSSPVNTVAPAITPASIEAGNVLTCSQGTWTGSPTPTFSYQWRNGGVNIGGAAASTYTTRNPDDVGGTIGCAVTADNGVGSPVQVEAFNDVMPTLPGGAWIPTNLGAKLEGWWDASQESATTALATFSDRSANGRDLVQNAAAGRPSIVAAHQNGLNAVLFDGNHDWMLTSVTFSTPNFMLFMVAQHDAVQPEEGGMYSRGTVVPKAWYSPSSKHIVFAHHFSALVPVSHTPGNVFLSTHVAQAGISYTTLDGVDGASSTEPYDTSALPFAIGSRRTDWQEKSMKGHIMEVVYCSSLTDDEIADVEGYLAHKWGIQGTALPVGHPHKGSSP